MKEYTVRVYLYGIKDRYDTEDRLIDEVDSSNFWYKNKSRERVDEPTNKIVKIDGIKYKLIKA